MIVLSSKIGAEASQTYLKIGSRTTMSMQMIQDASQGRARVGRTLSEAGFTLIELLIVMSVMLILMTLAVPQLLKLRKQANETSAIQSVRTIGQAELQYNSAYPANGFSCSMATLGGQPGAGAPSAQAAQLIDAALTTGQKAGYTFNIIGCSKVTVNNQDMYTSYTITAVPQSIGKTGDRGFCADENNTIRFDPAGGTNCTQPIQ